MAIIAHLADIHYRSLSRHDEYRTVFKAFVEDVKRNNVDHIYVGGDIFHTKTIGISPEFIDEITWWLTTLAETAELHITLGNHDGNLVNLSRQDAISPIVTTLNHPRIHLYKDSGVFEFTPGFNFCNFSLFDEAGWKNVIPEEGKINISCYHGPVRGATTESDWELDEGLSLEFFSDFDFTFLGDIHKFQYLDYRETSSGDKKPYIAYPGSTVQQNYAEHLEHGYLLWDIKSVDDFNVEFKALPNPKPFVTIDWEGTATKTIKEAKKFPVGTRFRIRSQAKIPSKDSIKLTKTLKKEHKASEVAFKDDYIVDRSKVKTGDTTIVKDDLRNPDVLLKLLKDNYAGSEMHDQEWHSVYGLLKKYLGMIESDATPKNLQWNLKRVDFDNLYGYGENNVINFESLSGLVGLFGPNRSGKSSIPGVLMYTGFNSSDRGTIKNKNIVNTRKDYGKGKMYFSVNGVEHVAERTTTKSTTKKGTINAPTDLSLWRIDPNGEAKLLNGEQRTDTEKVLRKLIGSTDDFLMTSLSSQDGGKMFLEQGATKRRQILSRFLGVDILFNIHDLSNQDIKDQKAILRSMRELDWDTVSSEKKNLISSYDDQVKGISFELTTLSSELFSLKSELEKYNDLTPVTKADVSKHEKEVETVRKLLDGVKNKKKVLLKESKDSRAKLDKIDKVLLDYDLDGMKSQLETIQKIQSTIEMLQTVFNTESKTLERQKKTLKILQDVPCGDDYQTCKFIRDAHETKIKVEPQKEKIKESKEKLDSAIESLGSVDVSSLESSIKKIEMLKERRSQLEIKIHRYDSQFVKLNSDIESFEKQLVKAKSDLVKIKKRYDNDENAVVAELKAKIHSCEHTQVRLEKESLRLASLKGKAQSELENVMKDKKARERVLQEMKAHEVILSGFSKKGIPNMIVSSMLPVINEEITKILNGIVNFSVELEKDVESDQVDIYINYGDSRRILELGSGMEKTMSSIALRVALINVSTLPKTDLFIIDEGFGAFDNAGIEECNRLLRSLKRFFKTIMIITHVDSIKDVVDNVIEITKNENDSQIVYN